MGQAIEQVVESYYPQIQIVPTGGTAENLQKLETNQVQCYAHAPRTESYPEIRPTDALREGVLGDESVLLFSDADFLIIYCIFFHCSAIVTNKSWLRQVLVTASLGYGKFWLQRALIGALPVLPPQRTPYSPLPISPIVHCQLE